MQLTQSLDATNRMRMRVSALPKYNMTGQSTHSFYLDESQNYETLITNLVNEIPLAKDQNLRVKTT